MAGCVAVFDIGKTNIKLVVFDRGGAILAERSAPNASLDPDAAGRICGLTPRAHGLS